MMFAYRSIRHPVLLVFAVSLFCLSACATPRQGPELPPMVIGVAGFTQPRSIAEMLAGYMAEDAPRVSEKHLAQLDEALSNVLGSETDRDFNAPVSYAECRNAALPGQSQSRGSALRHWVAVGKCMKVEFLLVPQVYELQERQGGEAGVTRPAGIIMDIFLIDVRNSVLTSRSHFNETQTALADNLLNTRKFFSRGARWVTAVELAREGMVKAVRDIGL